MNDVNAHLGKVVHLGTSIGDLCSIATFASACGIPVEDVTEWVNDGTFPSTLVAGERLVNVLKLRADLLGGKEGFNAGDYDHE